MARFGLFRRVTPVAFVGGAVVLASCQHFVDKPIKPADTASALLDRSLANPQLREFLQQNLGHDLPDWPLKTWDFETLNWVAFYYNPTLDVARAQWAVARGGIVTAAQSPNPSVSTSAGYDFNASAVGAKSPWFPGVGFDWPIETAGKRDKRIKRADAATESARQAVFAAAWQVRTDLRRTMIEYETAQRRAAALRDITSAQRRVLDLLEQRLNAGAVATDEISTSRIAFVKAQADAGDAARQLGIATSRLAQILGVPVSALGGFDINAAQVAQGREFSATELADARRLCLQSRPDILSALANYDASQAALQLEIAKQWPDLHVGSGYLYDLGENKWDLTFGVELPVMNMNEGPIAEAEASRRLAAAQLVALQASVIATIDTAAAANQAAEGTVADLRRVRDELNLHRDRVRAQYDAGAADQLDYQSALLDAAASELALTDAESQAALATGQLEDAFQVPFTNIAAVQKDPHPITASNSP